MINANEIRIGNWVNFCYTYNKKELNRYCQVISIGNDIVVLDKGVSLVAEFEPIPLTPEILLKCGFEILQDWYDKSGIVITNKMEFNFETGYCEQLVTKIKYVHQLQNLFFALTESELEIKL